MKTAMKAPTDNGLFANSKVALLVPAQELEADDRYGWFAKHLQGETKTLVEIALDCNKTVWDSRITANILFEEGYLEKV